MFAAQFSINFSLVWDPCVKLLGSYLHCEEFRPLAWKIFQEIFECVNGKEASTEIGVDKVDYPNIRSLMLKALANADQEFIHKFVEKNHTWFVNQFLDVYLGNSDLSKTKGKRRKQIHVLLNLGFTKTNISVVQVSQNTSTCSKSLQTYDR